MHRRTLCATTVLVAVAAGALAGAAPAQAATVTTVFLPTADSYVSAANPNTNYDSTNILAVGSSPDRTSYVKFAVAGLTATVTRARLRLHVRDAVNAGSPSGGTVQRVGTSWSEEFLTYANRPAAIGGNLAVLGAVARNTWYDVDVAAAVAGNSVVAFAVASSSADGAYYDSREVAGMASQLVVETGSSSGGSNVLLAAGDIATCSGDGDEQTARLLDAEPGVVLPDGDLTGDGSAAELRDCYDPTWGRHKARSRPAIGNHDYLVSGAAPYFAYFGAAAGDPDKGYYSFDVAGWHIVALNSDCSEIGGCQAGSPQERWLRADLAAHPAACTLAYWHHPLFASGGRQSSGVKPLFQALYDAGAEVVINGHNHQYERFAPQSPSGTAEPTRGVREFIVGTGGRSLQAEFPDAAANSEVRNGTTFGVIKLTLASTGYSWRFLPVAGQTFTDSGSGTCH